MLRPLNRTLLAALEATGSFRPLTKLIAGQLDELDERGRPKPVAKGQGRLSVLALSPDEFRSDLEVLAARKVRVLRMSHAWQRWLLYSFYRGGIETGEIHRPPAGTATARAKSDYRRFLETFLPQLYRELDVDIVISANVKYKEDLDWGVVSKKLGVPYVVLHRENLAVTEGVVNVLTERYRRLGHFEGTCIAVHNGSTTRTLTATDYACREHIFELGCLRMDSFLQRLRAPRQKRARPLVTLFSFKSFMRGIFGSAGYFPVFRDSHGPIALLAQQHPEVDFLIKPKSGTFRNPRFLPELRAAFRHWGVDPKRLPPNLRVDPTLDAQDTILESSVVLALNSTTQLEAALAGLPVIMPYFKDMREAPAGRNVKFRDRLDLFDVPDTPDDLMKLVLRRLKDPVVPPDVMEKRRALFAEFVSSLNGDATERYIDLLERVVAEEAGKETANRLPANKRSSVGEQFH
jgi:hypothetical protein